MRGPFPGLMGLIFAISSQNITIITLLRTEIWEINLKSPKRVVILPGISNFFNLIFPPLEPEKINSIKI
jgi:hypothetical protein